MQTSDRTIKGKIAQEAIVTLMSFSLALSLDKCLESVKPFFKLYSIFLLMNELESHRWVWSEGTRAVVFYATM